jgi:hypothetical protein
MWDVPGDTSAFPWIGRASGSQAVLAFPAETAAKVVPVRPDIDDILGRDTRAVVGHALLKQNGFPQL